LTGPLDFAAVALLTEPCIVFVAEWPISVLLPAEIHHHCTKTTGANRPTVGIRAGRSFALHLNVKTYGQNPGHSDSGIVPAFTIAVLLNLDRKDRRGV
jgi:hypothetical protein